MVALAERAISHRADRDRDRPSLSVRPPVHRGRHDPRRPALPLRPAPGSERARLELEADRHPGWELTGAGGLAPEEGVEGGAGGDDAEGQR